jgi:hypothetical protein
VDGDAVHGLTDEEHEAYCQGYADAVHHAADALGAAASRTAETGRKSTSLREEPFTLVEPTTPDRESGEKAPGARMPYDNQAYADGLEVGYRVGYTIGSGGTPPPEVARAREPRDLKLVWSQQAGQCSRSRRRRPSLKVVV